MMGGIKRVGLTDMVRSALDTRPDDEAGINAVEIAPAAADTGVPAVPTDVIEAVSIVAAEFRDDAFIPPEIAPSKTETTEVVPPAPPLATAAPPNATTIIEPAPYRIGVLGALGGVAGAVALPALLGLGTGIAPLVGCMALGTLAGLAVASPPSPRPPRSKK